LQALRRIFYAVIIENKTHGLGKETNFEFKYIPNYHTNTEKGENESPMPKPIGGGIERRNLTTFIIASVAIGLGSWLVFNVVWVITGGLLQSLSRTRI